MVELTLGPPLGEVTHWTAPAMAKTCGISPGSVQRIWRSHGLQPHRFRQFKLSKDPKFVEKLQDIVGLCMAPPAHALILSIDGKSQVQALDRTQPRLPMKKGRCGTMTRDYKRHGTPISTARPCCSASSRASGRKDRFAMLSPMLLDILREWCRIGRPCAWLFPGQNPVNP